MSKHYITVKNKRYSYTLTSKGKDLVHVQAKAAGVDQVFHKADLAEFLENLPMWIIDRQKEQKESVLRFRVNPKDKKRIEKLAVQKGYKSVSEYVRDRALQS